jgi:UDP-GlcNAc:undecaprenyl-phosphate GlcNAc-1-phosphate transferase
MDAGLAIGRRFLRQKPIFGADRAHIHHKLLSRGLTTRRVVLVLYGICGLGAAASLVLAETRAQYQGFVFVLLFPAALLGLRYLGYKEFSVAGKLALDGSFQRQVNAHLSLLEFEEALSGSVTLDQCSTVLCSTCTEFGFSGVELRLDGVVRHRKSAKGWRVRIDFPGHGYINLMRESGSTTRIAPSALFIDSVHRAFGQKLSKLETSRSESRMYAHGD